MNMATQAVSSGIVKGRLDGKVCLITGAGSGQGQCTALLFAQAGATVLASDIQQEGLQQTRNLAAERQLTIETRVVDAASEAQVQQWVGDAVLAHRRIDVLYNNAAGVHMAPFADMTLLQWHETLRLELDVIFVPTRAVWSHMTAAQRGSIVNIASISGMSGSEGLGTVAHAAGKGGVIAVTRQLSVEGAPFGIRVNSISPGPILTPASQPMYDNSDSIRRMFDGWPSLGRAGQSIDVAFAGLFLASDESSFITGINLPVDGGATSKLGITDRKSV